MTTTDQPSHVHDPHRAASTPARPVADAGARRRSVVAAPALAAGGLVALSLPPWGFWPVAFAGLALLAWRLVGLPLRARMLAGLLFGIGLFGPTLFWMSEFHAVGYAAVVLLETSFFVVALGLLPPGSRGRNGASPRAWPSLVAFPGAIVVAEWARGEVPFGGLPMGGIPLGQADGWLVPAARIGGALLVTGLAATAGAALAALVIAARRRAAGGAGADRSGVAVPAAALVGVAVVAALGLVVPDGEPTGGDPLRTAVVQGGGPRGFRAVESDAGRVYRVHVDAARRLDPPLDLVLFPENVVDVDRFEGSVAAAELARQAERVGATFVVGVTEDANEGRNFVNAAVAFGPDGRLRGRYVKVNRVPFGEYVPGRALFERLADLSVLPRDAVPGEGAGLLETPAGDLGALISFEVFFPERSRSAVRAGAEVLLVPTNAASFTTTQVPGQEVAAAQLRAWETGRWTLQAAPTGFSAVVSPTGDVVARTALSTTETLVADVPLRTGRTPYVAAGDLPVLGLAVAMVALGVGAGRRRGLAEEG